VSSEPDIPPAVLGSGAAPLARTVVAPKPAGLDPAAEAYWDALGNGPPAMKFDDHYILWTGLPKGSAEGKVLDLQDQLKEIPGSPLYFTSSFNLHYWGPAFRTYDATDPPNWKINSIVSIRFAEYIANQESPVHVLYGSSALESKSYFPYQLVICIYVKLELGSCLRSSYEP
jgi:hypothetical protein